MPPPAAPSLKPVQELANELGLLEDELTPYGRYKGKIALAADLKDLRRRLSQAGLAAASGPDRSQPGSSGPRLCRPPPAHRQRSHVRRPCHRSRERVCRRSE